MKNKSGLNHYKIFRVENENGKDKKITMTKFDAKDDNAAYEELKRYRKIANKQFTYYYGTTGYYVDGDKHYDSAEEMFDAWKNDMGFFESLWRDIIRIFVDSPKDFYYKIKDILYFIKTGHARNESWSIDSHIVNDIIYNIPLLLKNKQGIAQCFIDEAIIEAHKNDKTFDLNKYYEKNPNVNDKNIENRALEIQEKTYNELLNAALLYCYYGEFGIIDKKNKLECEIEKKYKNTLPYRPGTYYEFDYVKLNALTQKNWNRIWALMQKYGQTLWD